MTQKGEEDGSRVLVAADEHAIRMVACNLLPESQATRDSRPQHMAEDVTPKEG